MAEEAREVRETLTGSKMPPDSLDPPRHGKGAGGVRGSADNLTLAVDADEWC